MKCQRRREKEEKKEDNDEEEVEETMEIKATSKFIVCSFSFCALYIQNYILKSILIGLS